MSKAERNENEDIFYNDWVACLCAHYLYTLEQGDVANTLSLRRVLLEAGVSEAYIDSLVLPAMPSAESEIVVITQMTDAVESFDAEVLLTSEPEMVVAAAVEETPPIEIVAVFETQTMAAEAEAIDLPLELPAALDENAFLTTSEPVAVMEVSLEVTPAPPTHAEPALTPDYPSGAKPKRGKRPPPPQPTLF